MTPVIKIINKSNLNISPLNLNENMIYFNNDFHGQEEKPIIPIQGCLNVSISNVSASFNVKSHLNLRHLALHGHNVEYRREKAVIL